jgi:hypothetical protein
MATPHTTGVAALALEAAPSSTPQAVTDYLVSTATLNRLTLLNTGSPHRLLFSMGAGAPSEPPTPSVAVKSLTGSKVRTSGGWTARATIAVRDVATGTAVANAVVAGSFAPGGSGQCTTTSTGTCSITSPFLERSIAASVFTVGNITATGAIYDASQNAASQVTINQR